MVPAPNTSQVDLHHNRVNPSPNPFFQQIPCLSSGECLEQLNISSALSGRLKAVLSSPLLLFLGLLENGEQGLYQPGRNPGNPCSLI